MTEERSVAAHLAAELPSFGVTHVFELVGGMITVMIDALHGNPALRVVSMHHEQAAGFAAEGFTRMAGRPAVAMATSGPGATNLLTAIGSCYFDSIPVVFITGQVNRTEMRREGRGRQGGFQETDIVAMAEPVTKLARYVMSAEEFPALLREAFRVATSGRPGPVLLDIPMDVQRSPIPVHELQPDHGVTARPPAAPAPGRSAEFLEELTSAVRGAKRPLILVGGGARSAGSVPLLRSVVDDWGVPVVTSLLGLDAIPATSPLRAGFIGSYGNRWANWAVAQSDVLVVLGSRLDVRQTGSDVNGFRGERRVFHVDIDSSELNNHVPGCTVLDEDLAEFLRSAASNHGLAPDTRDDWLAAIAARRQEWPDIVENTPERGLNPNEIVRRISRTWDDVGAYVTDVGQHQMWAAQSVEIGPEQRFLTSGGMGSMGFGLPAAIGAALADSTRPVCLIAGDGGFQCNLQELQTITRLGLPIRMVVLDNGCHGMVRQFQQTYFEGRYHSTKWGYSAPDFRAVAHAYDVPSMRAETPEELEGCLAVVRAQSAGPSLIHVPIESGLNVYPKMAFGQPFGSMEPQVPSIEMEGT